MRAPAADHRPTAEAIMAHLERIGVTRYRKLPTEMQLARALGVTRYAVRQGLAVLRDEGQVRAEPGIGWYAT